MTGRSAPELSVVVLAYNMARELPRTLRSLSPAYQHRPPAGPWEVIVVDNGSPVPVRQDGNGSDGLDVRVVRTEPDTYGSLAGALNYGIGLARGALIGVWIDGARLASPGLLGACSRAAALHPRPVVATRNYHLGPALQHEARMASYDQTAEDRLLASINWPAGANRLTAIATPEQPDPAGPLLETNAIFMPRTLWQELGGFDARFRGPGGGAVNIDLFLRAVAAPDTRLIRIPGEGTFHQFHGGVTTGAGPAAAAALLKLGSRQYLRLRGRPMRAVRGGRLYDSRTDTVGTESDRVPA